MATKLAPGQISDLDPYKFMAVIGKRVIHPGGRASTEALLRRAQITGAARVLDVGCGVATTAIEIARRCGLQSVAWRVGNFAGSVSGSYALTVPKTSRRCWRCGPGRCRDGR
jgi:hypothetical protein